MKSKFRVHVIIRIILILGLGWAAIYFLYTPFWLMTFWCSLGAFFVLINLIRYVESHRRELQNFLTSINQGDYSTHFGKQGSVESDISDAYQTINNALKDLRDEKESHSIFLQTTTEHISVPLLVYDETDKILLANEAVKLLLGKPFINSLDSLIGSQSDLKALIKSLNNEEKKLFNFQSESGLKRLSIQATEIRLNEKYYKIISLQDISRELDTQELESFQKLIRVLTHEIMNSAIPISTLAEVLNELLDGREIKSLTEDEEKDLSGGLLTIKNRTKGLVRFVESYKSMTRLPAPKMERFSIKELLKSIELLVKKDFIDQKVNLHFQSVEATLLADRELIEQVVLNLIKNAREACLSEEKPLVNVQALENESIQINIRDNGPGIPKEEMENIFIPFYTTKKKGSGIGLSISRRIMALHQGSIGIIQQHKETIFQLTFPK